MPPVTRRRAKDAENVSESKIIPPKESSRAKRKSTVGEESKVEIPTSPKPKKSRTSAVPDSQDKERSWLLSSVSKQLEEDATQRLASSQSLGSDQTPAPKPKGKHLVFDDDDDVENFVVAAAEAGKKAEEDKNKEEKEEESDDDDDDAPEAVSTQVAAKEVQKSAQAALDAAEKQTATLKRKRQERDNLFKQQAERRKRARAEVETAVTTGRRRTQKHALPTHLPAEFLTDSSSEDEDEDEDGDGENGQALKKRRKLSDEKKRPTKITFDDQPKKPRDRVVGSTKYRVLAEQGDSRLAPRARRDARASKESLLKRRRVGVAPATGAATGRGFFVKR
ncbi:uncharacterized protein F4812DRAFT_321747 [Daldinia caldariorum]|uniref:uncharacterized protein n=1 Tax=Daldinia caldariorum TaxID=326644 RepID=UPI002008B586|nr:uncharacterized protein F4812DRAFT_321747 [Daldinia caldariorum]KAI1469201.1 hypothetical protein F4812DRAFT_321747 [Daldinia caldariorum]